MRRSDRVTQKDSDTETGRPDFLVFLVIVFLLPSVFPFSGFPLTTFPNISLASVCVWVCVSGAMGWRVWLPTGVTRDTGAPRSLSLSPRLSMALSHSFSAVSKICKGKIPPKITDSSGSFTRGQEPNNERTQGIMRWLTRLEICYTHYVSFLLFSYCLIN